MAKSKNPLGYLFPTVTLFSGYAFGGKYQAEAGLAIDIGRGKNGLGGASFNWDREAIQIDIVRNGRLARLEWDFEKGPAVLGGFGDIKGNIDYIKYTVLLGQDINGNQIAYLEGNISSGYAHAQASFESRNPVLINLLQEMQNGNSPLLAQDISNEDLAKFFFDIARSTDSLIGYRLSCGNGSLPTLGTTAQPGTSFCSPQSFSDASQTAENSAYDPYQWVNDLLHPRTILDEYSDAFELMVGKMRAQTYGASNYQANNNESSNGGMSAYYGGEQNASFDYLSTNPIQNYLPYPYVLNDTSLLNYGAYDAGATGASLFGTSSYADYGL